MGPRPDPRLNPVVRGGLTDRVIDQLRRRIADGTWALNERLPVEAALARELEVGRSTIREAVRVLVHSGMLEVRQGDGTYVRSVREIDAVLRRRAVDADLLDAFQVRRGLEVEMARLAATNGSDADVAHLRELAAARDAAAGPESRRRAEAMLHDHVLEMSGNALLADLYRGLVEPLRTTLSTTFDDAELTRDDPRDPETAALVEAIAAHDADAAIAAVVRRMDTALRVLTVLLQAVPVRR